MIHRAQLLSWAGFALLLVLRPDASYANPTPPSPPYAIRTADDLRDALATNYGLGRYAAVRQLRRLGPRNLPLVEEALESQYEDVQRAAITALAYIGNAAAQELLLKVVQDSTLYEGIRVAAAEALADTRDKSFIPVLEEITKETDNDYVRRFVRKAIERIHSPRFDAPLMVLEEQALWFRFVLDDIASIRITDIHGEIIHTFPFTSYQTICDLLQEGRPARFTMHMEVRELRIELKDGSLAILGIHENQVVYKDWSRYWHSWGFSMSNSKLMPFVEEAIRKQGAGIYEQ